MTKTKINTKKFTPYLTTVLLGLAVFGIFLFLVLPQFRFFQEAREIKKQADAQFTNVNSELEALKKTVEQLDRLSEGQRVAIDQALPIGQNLEEFLRNFHKLAQAAGVIIVNLNISQDDSNSTPTDEQAVGPTGTVVKSNLSMTVRSSQQDFLKFIQSVQKDVRLIDITDVSLNDASSVQDNLDTVSANMNGILYHLDGVPGSPAFPYGHSLDVSIFEDPQFQNLNVSN